MAVVAQIDAHLDLNTGDFTGGITLAGAALRTFNTNINRSNSHVKSFGNSLMGTVVVLGQLRAALHTVWAMTGQWGAAIVDANAKLERMQVLMRGLSKATTEAGKTADALRDMNYVLDKAKSAPFSIDEISNAFVKMKAAGIDPTKGALDALMDGIAKFGGDDQTFHRATIAIQQMAGKGVISMEELRQQLGEAVPNAMQLLADATKMSMGELVKTIAKGTLESKTALAKLFIEMQIDSQGASERMMDTWVGMVSRLKTEWLLFAKEIGAQGLFDQAKTSLQELITFMQSADGRAMAANLGQSMVAAIRAISQFVKFLYDNREAILSFGKMIAMAFAAKWAAGFVSAIVRVGGSILQLNATMGTFRATMAASVTQATAAGGAIAGMGARIAALAGPIGIAIGLITALTLEMMDNERQANASAEAWRRYGIAIRTGADITPDMIQRGKDLLALQEKAKKMRDDIAAGKMKGWNPSDQLDVTGMVDEMHRQGVLANDSSNTTWGQRVAMLRRGLQNIAEESKKIRAGEARAAEQEARAQIASYADVVERTTEKEMTAANNRLNELRSKKANGVPGMDAMMEQERLRRNSIQLGLWQGEVNRMKKLVDETPSNNPNMTKYAEQYRIATEKLGQYQEERAAIMVPNKILTGTGNSAEEKEMKKQEDKLEAFIASVKGKIAGLNAQLMDGNVKLATFNQNVDDKLFGAAPDKGKLAEARKQLEELAATMDRVKKERVFESAMQSVEDLGARADADLLTQKMRDYKSDFGNVTQGMISFNREVAITRSDLVAAWGEGSNKVKDFDAALTGVIAKQGAINFENLRRFIEDKEWDNRMAKLPEHSRRQEIFNRRISEYAKLRADLIRQGRPAGEVDEMMARLRAADEAEFMQGNRSGLQEWIDENIDAADEVHQAWKNGMDGIAQSITDAIMTGKAGFKDLARTILAEIVKILVSKAVAQLAQFIGGLFGSFGGNISGTNIAPTSGLGIGSMGPALAKGGVMTSNGLMPLHAYSNGGIANKPQLALFGEGRLPEAYVPLPDGKNIPVKMDGGAGGIHNNVQIGVTINQDGSASGDKSADTNSGRELAAQLDGRVRQLLVQEARPGGIIWRMNKQGVG